MDDEVHKKISAELAKLRTRTSECRRNFAEENFSLIKQWASDTNPNHQTLDSIVDWDLILEGRIKRDSSIRRRYERFQEGCSEYFRNSEFETWLRNEQAKYKKENWNATKLDLAVAVLSHSPDSLVKNIEFKKAEIWLTASLKTGKHSQLLLGINGQTFRDLPGYMEDKRYYNFSIPARYLLGTNRAKAFAEAQYSYSSIDKSKFMLNLGTELNVIDGLWINAYGGLDYNLTDETGTWITNFNIKMTLPENFHFF